MKMPKFRRITKIIGSKLSLIFSIPSVWLALSILVCAIISILISKSLYTRNRVFSSSVFSNISTGLITGLAISILSGTKSTFNAYLEAKYLWLKDTHTAILEFNSMFNGLISSSGLSNEEFSDKAYDTGARAFWVNDRIALSTFDKTKWFDPPKYFLKNYGYDCFEASKRLEVFRESLFDVGWDVSKRHEDFELFRPIVNKMMDLNSKILDDMQQTNIKIAGLKKFIL